MYCRPFIGRKKRSTISSLFLSKKTMKMLLFRLYSRNRTGLSWQEHVSARIKLGQAPSEWLYQLKWVQKSSAEPGGPPRFSPGERWLIFADREGLGIALSERLKASQQECTLVYPEDRPSILNQVRYVYAPKAVRISSNYWNKLKLMDCSLIQRSFICGTWMSPRKRH